MNNLPFKPLPPITMLPPLTKDELKPVEIAAKLEDKLTRDQIKHWRDVLLGIVGPYALLMPDDHVQLFRDRMQERLTKDFGAAD